MSLNFKSNTPKELIFEHVAEYLHLQNLKINKQDNTRPWGGFFVIDEAEAEKFIALAEVSPKRSETSFGSPGSA